MRLLALWLMAGGLVMPAKANVVSADNNGSSSPTIKSSAAAGKKEAEKELNSAADAHSSGPEAKLSTSESSAIENELAEIRGIMQRQNEELEAQRAALREQERKLNALTKELRANRGAAATAEAPMPPLSTRENDAAATVASTSAAPQNDGARADKMEKALAETQAKLKAIGPFTFSGDFRLRDEPFFGGPADQSQMQNRERFRARLNISAKLNEELSGGISLSSGDIHDPISTNQTTNQFYTRKIFALDRAFISYTPHGFKPLTLTGGKFAYPFYRTELVWDNDLNPEGVAQTLAWDFESIPVLKRLAVVGFELPFTEVAGVSVANRSIVQSAVYGGQLQSVWSLTSWLKLSAYGAFYNYHNADPIALALRQASASNPQTPLLGLLPLAGGSVQNSITAVTRTSVVTVNGTPVPTGVNTVVSAQFASKFALLDGIARFDIKTPYERWPILVLGDYVQNTRACANSSNLPTAAQVANMNTATATFSLSTSAACNSRERRGYWLEGRLGRAQEKGDWQLAYTRMFIEREAVMGAFNFSDMRQNSNVSQHRFELFYQAHKNVQLAFTGLFGRPLNFGSAAPPENFLKRLQFDVFYKF